ncbi:MAG: restriction endonuclease subunit S [Bacteroidia bacterium]|nr:restriction endonuclease subunit S [Bacteroidia bacterium]MCZ2277198.1 restriction endonuclease subunit S [Bacteroidia bacterium]
MKLEKLGNIADFKMGQAPHSDTYNDKGEGTLLIKAGDFGFHYPTPTEYTTNPIAFSEEGDVLICVVGATSGKVNKGINASITRSIAAIRSHEEKLNSDFLFYFLRSSYSRINKMTSGSAQGIISKPILAKIEIPLPSLSDQLHIANILSKAENLIAQRKESIRLLDEFLKSTFLEMFGDPVRNEKGWETKPLGELCNIRRGASPRPINNFIGDEVPWIKIGDGTKGNDLYIESTQVSITKEGASKSVLLDEGSLVFANCGVSLGFARILKIKGCIHDGWLSFENIKSELDKIYLLKLLNNSTEYLRRIAPDGTQPNLNTGIMKNFKIILPPINLQTQFALIVEKTEALKTQYQQSLSELENLYGSLSQKAFRGELTQNNNHVHP